MTCSYFGELCYSCRKALHRQAPVPILQQSRPTRSHYAYEHHKTILSLALAADSGCRVCSVLFEALPRQEKDDDEEVSTQCVMSHEQLRLFIEFAWAKSGILSESGLELSIMPPGDPGFQKIRDGHRQSPLSQCLGDHAVLDMADKWLARCVSGNTPEHQDCEMTRRHRIIPKRLLDIRDGKVRLSTMSERTTETPYCTLSYCWGKRLIEYKLRTSNEGEFYNAIDHELLPKSIQDAIYVARALRFDYIWIDCLCIIQDGDNGRDWEWHVQHMVVADIYAHAVLNISADRARSVYEGFLGKRTGLQLRPTIASCHLTCDKSEDPVDCAITFRRPTDLVLAAEPLASRAWVFSERLSSPRSLHFTSGELFWECSGLPIASESCPDGFGTELLNSNYAGFTAKPSLQDHDPVLVWRRIISVYTQLSLTYPTKDKIVALSGAARLFEQTSGYKMVAGLIFKAMPRTLLWFTNTPAVIGPRATEYRAPSWSWASCDGQVAFPWANYHHDIARVRGTLAHYHRGEYSRLRGGNMTLCGPYMLYKDLVNHWKQSEVPNLYVTIDQRDRKIRETDVLVFLVKCADNTVKGIVIAPCDDNKWSRVGYFYTSEVFLSTTRYCNVFQKYGETFRSKKSIIV